MLNLAYNVLCGGTGYEVALRRLGDVLPAAAAAVTVDYRPGRILAVEVVVHLGAAGGAVPSSHVPQLTVAVKPDVAARRTIVLLRGRVDVSNRQSRTKRARLSVALIVLDAGVPRHFVPSLRRSPPASGRPNHDYW